LQIAELRCVLSLFYIKKICGKIKPALVLDVLFLKPRFMNFLFFFFETGFLCIALACPGTHFVDQVGLKLRNPPASASQVLGLKVCATTTHPAQVYEVTSSFLFFFFLIFNVCEYTVAVFIHTRRGHLTPLLMVVSHLVVAGI